MVLKLMKKAVVVVIGLVFLGGFVLPASAEVTLEDILRRVEALERENVELKAEVASLKGAQSAQAAAITEVKSKAETLAAVPAAAPAGNFLKTKMDTELYGFISAVAVYSDSDAATAAGTNSSTAASTASRETNGKNMGSFNASAQETRLGLNFKAPDLEEGGKVSGKLEFDFAANSGPTYQPRLRLAYAQLDYAKWGITAGQAWDFFDPLNTGILNFGSLFRSGNAGNRHPQVYMTNRWGELLGGKLTTQVGIIDSDDPYQENSVSPVSGVYAKYETKILGRETSLGAGGIYGRNSSDILGTRGGKAKDIYGTFVDLTVKGTDRLSFKAEGFSGAKLDDFNAGPTIGLTSATLAIAKPIRVRGGFSEVVYKATRKLETTLGMGLDSVDGDTTMDSGYRDDIWKTNRTYYSNMKYSLSKDLMLGLEYQYYDTQWFDGVKGQSNRVLSTVVYKF